MTDTMNRLITVMARRCGLQDPDAFARAGGVWASKPDMALRAGRRGTGRTTRTLLRVLVALESGATVGLIAACADHARYLREQIGAMVKAADLPHDALDDLSISWLGHSERENVDVRLVDHWAREVILAPPDDRRVV